MTVAFNVLASYIIANRKESAKAHSFRLTNKLLHLPLQFLPARSQKTKQNKNPPKKTQKTQQEQGDAQSYPKQGLSGARELKMNHKHSTCFPALSTSHGKGLCPFGTCAISLCSAAPTAISAGTEHKHAAAQV